MKGKILNKLRDFRKWLFHPINKNRFLVFSFIFLFFVCGAYLGVNEYRDSKIEKIGWVTDIHADRSKRDVDSGLLYPKKYQEYLPEVFQAMKNEGISVVIATGDNTNSGDDNYARDIVRIAKEEEMNVIWVRGNHDNDEVMEILGVKKGEQYYYRDLKNTRIIVLDTTEYPNGEYDYAGWISEKQMNWIREALKTDKENIIIAMHMPIFEENTESINIHDLVGNFTGLGNVLERYVELEKMLRESGKVKIVLSGHWHVTWQKEFNGVRYYGASALTRKGEEGAYAVVNLENSQLDYKFAK